MPTAALWAAASQVSQGIPPWVVAPPSLPSGSAGGGLSAAFPDAEMSVRILAYLGADPTAASSTWPAAVDLTSRLLDEPIRITLGRGQNQRTLQSGSCSFLLDNNDGALTPLLATSTYYPGWDFGVPISIDISGVPPNPAAWYPRFRGYAADITPEILSNAGTSTKSSVVRVTLGGIVRRLSLNAPVKSAIRRTVSHFASLYGTAYWPMEDGTGSTQFGYDGVANGSPLQVTTATFSSDSTLVGSDPLPVFTAATALNGTASGTATGGWLCQFFLRIPAALGGLATLMEVRTTGGSAVRWVFSADATTFYAIAYDSAGTAVHSGSSSSGYSDLVSGNWLYVIFNAQDATQFQLDFRLASTNAGGGVITVSSATVVGGTPVSLAVPASSFLTGVSMGHLSLWSGPSVPTGTWAGSDGAATGYNGEIAWFRAARIAAEEGVAFSTGFSGSSLYCGPQANDDAISVLRDTETIDHGVLRESIADWALNFVNSGARVDLPSKLTIDLSTYDVSTGAIDRTLTPTRNDQRVRNEWTIGRPDGATVTARDATHQTLRGRYAESDQVNVFTDADVANEAGWRVWEGTRDLLRYRQTALDLAANPDQISAWLTIALGDRLDRIHHPSPPHPNDDASFVLEGYTEVLERRSWEAQLVLEPYAPWQVGILADTSGDLSPDLGRLAGDAKAAIRADISSSATSIAFDPFVYRWTTDSDDFTPALRVRLTNTTGVAGGGETFDMSSIATTAATLVAAGAMSSADNAAVTPAMYAGAVADDWIVVVARIRSASAGTIGIGADYTRINVTGTDTSTPIQIWVKKHSGTESAPTVLPTGGAAGDTVSAFTFGLRSMPIATTDLNDAVVESSFLSNASAQDIAFPGLGVVKNSAPIDGCVVVLIGGKDDDWTSVATVSGLTELVDSSTTTGNDQGLVLDYVIQTTATPVPHGSFTVTGGANAVSEGIAIAFAGGYQTMTVATRSVNGVIKAHSAGTKVEVEAALVLAL